MLIVEQKYSLYIKATEFPVDHYDPRTLIYCFILLSPL